MIDYCGRLGTDDEEDSEMKTPMAARQAFDSTIAVVEPSMIIDVTVSVGPISGPNKIALSRLENVFSWYRIKWLASAKEQWRVCHAESYSGGGSCRVAARP
jgi:hypothetical protein